MLDALQTLHHLVLALFVGTTALLFVTTLINRLRIRRVQQSWCAGRLFGLPLLPTLFLLLVTPLFLYAWLADTAPQFLSAGLLAGYLIGGAFWYAAAVLFNSVLVTDFGIIRNVNRLGEAVAWGQVIDYASAPKSASEDVRRCTQLYVLIFDDRTKRRNRLELRVPASQHDRFHELVQSKLDARFDFALEQAYGGGSLRSREWL
ncbi:MAG: hypothetical protein AAF752_01575 [Bacteroidota bacterium]